MSRVILAALSAVLAMEDAARRSKCKCGHSALEHELVQFEARVECRGCKDQGLRCIEFRPAERT